MRGEGIDARYTPAFADVIRQLRKGWKPGDVVITLGCGDIDRLNKELAESEK